MSEQTTKLNCSFCGKEQSKVKKLIAGPNIYICNECVDLCNDILVEEEKAETKVAETPKKLEEKKEDSKISTELKK